MKHLKKVFLKWWRHQKQIHQKQDHQKLKIIRRWKNQGFKGCSKVLITPSIAEDRKSKATANSNEFEGIGFLFFEERWQSTIVRSVQPLPPLLSLCLCYRTRITTMSEQCSFILGMDLKLILHRTITISGKRSLVIDQSFKQLLSWCAGNSQRLFHTFI